jgi:putative peptidoglycan lipid II flippase
VGREGSFLRLLAVVFGGTLAVQIIAFLRQLIIASAFGIDRTMDLYLLVFSVATVTGLTVGTVMENASVPALVSRLEERDEAGFQQVALRILMIGAAFGLAAALLFLILVPPFASLALTGLTEAERAEMVRLSFWFVPWILISVPFYAVASLLKAKRRFRRFMAAEVIITLVSAGLLLVWRPGVHAIAVAYGLGYTVGLISMLPGLGLVYRLEGRGGGTSWGVLRQTSRFLAASQFSTFGMLADRFLASHLPGGAIAAGSYASLITGQTSALLGFRDAFMVPLSEAASRSQKFERVLIGLVLLSVPPAAFLAMEAHTIVSILLERGRFDRAATDLTALMLTIQAFAIPSGAVALPMFRMLQILNRMRMIAAFYLSGACFMLLFGSIAIFGLKLGIAGYAAAATAASVSTMLLVATMVHIAGVRPDWLRLLRYGAFAVVVALAGWLAVRQLPPAPSLFLGLLFHGAAFAVVFALAYGAIHRRIRALLEGTALPDVPQAP